MGTPLGAVTMTFDPPVGFLQSPMGASERLWSCGTERRSPSGRDILDPCWSGWSSGRSRGCCLKPVGSTLLLFHLQRNMFLLLLGEKDRLSEARTFKKNTGCGPNFTAWFCCQEPVNKWSHLPTASSGSQMNGSTELPSNPTSDSDSNKKMKKQQTLFCWCFNLEKRSVDCRDEMFSCFLRGNKSCDAAEMSRSGDDVGQSPSGFSFALNSD